MSAVKWRPAPRRSASALRIWASVHTPVGRRLHAAAQQHAALEVGHGALLFRPLGDRQHHVGLGRGLGQEQVRHHQEVEGAEPGAELVGRRRGDRDIGGEHQQAAYGRAERRQQLGGGQAGARQVVGIDAPDRRDLGAMPGIVDLAIAGKLVGLLAVLAAALPVALPGQAAIAAARLAGLAQRQRQIDEGEHIVDAMALLLGAAPGEHHGGGRLPQDVGGLFDLARRHAGDPLDAIGPIGRDDAADRVETGGARRDEARRRSAGALIATCSSPLASAASVPGVSCRCSEASFAVADRRGSTTMSLPPRRRCSSKYCISGGMVSAGIAADQKHRRGPRNVLQRERQAAIDPERTQPRRGGRRHAEAAVVVDVGGPQRDAGEFAQHVGLLVGEAAAAEHADRVGTRCRLDRTQVGGDAVERLVPAHRRAGRRPCARAPAARSAGRARRAIRRR